MAKDIQTIQIASISFNAKLYDDESVREKLTVMNKWEALDDDGRTFIPYEEFEEMSNKLQLGKTYRITVVVEELG